jgi:nucleoid DNA-binding protein
MATEAKPLNKTELLNNIANTTGLTKKQVGDVIDALTAEIKHSLSDSGPGAFSLPGLVKIEKKVVPAKPAQTGVKNPFTGELQDRPAKPASTKVKVKALKVLKSMV